MTNLFKTRNLYKLILLIFLIFSAIKIKNQFITLKTYDHEITILNEKIVALKKEDDNTMSNKTQSKEETENLARKDLKMYYPNETPYKGY